MVFSFEDTLENLMGRAIMERARFQWVKLIGPENVLNPTRHGAPLVIDREHLCREFAESKKVGATTNALANILLFYYSRWIRTGNNRSISGIIAEEIHKEITLLISRYWNLKWEPRDHKCPSNGIVNMFSRIRSQAMSKYLNIGLNVKHEKKVNEARIRSATCLLDRKHYHYLGGGFEIQSGARDVLLDWDGLFPPTPEEIYALSLSMELDVSQIA